MTKKGKKIYFKDENFLLLVGEKIRAARILQHLTIEALANESGIDYSQLGRMELGKVNFSISFIAKIAQALEINPKELLP